MNMDFVWNASAAEEVRNTCSQAMKSQIENMERTASSYAALARGLDTMAEFEENIAATAMTTAYFMDTQGNRTPRQVPATGARLVAASRGTDFRNQAADLRQGVVDLNVAIGELETAIETTDRLFETLHIAATQIDGTHSGQIRNIEQDIVAFANKMKIIRDSFNSDFPMMTLMNSLPGLEGVAYHGMVEGFLSAALRGFPVFTAFAGDPVNMATGNFIYNKEDLVIPGRYPLVFERFYNTIGDCGKGTMGYDWTHNFNVRLESQEKNISIAFGEGQIETYQDLGKEQYIPVLPSGKVLIKTDEGWALRSPMMETHLFDQEGRLVAITDINGVKKEFTYTDGNLSRVSTPSGHLLFTYDDEGYLIAVSDHSQRGMEYEYTEGRLTKVLSSSGESYRYIYDSQGRLGELFIPSGARETLTEFDSKNRARKQILADESTIEYIYDDYKKETTYLQQNGSKIIYKQDDKFRTTQIIYPDGSQRFEYDSENRKTLAVDKCGNETRYTYNDAGKVATITNSLGTKTEIAYSKYNQISSVTIDEEKKFQNHYDNQGDLVSIEDALQNETKFSYLQKGVPETITQPDGSMIQLTYDERKNITGMISPSGVTTSYEYDDLNRVIATIDGNGNETHYQYDAAGNVTQVRNALGDVRNYDYNLANKVTKMVDFNNTCIQREYNELNKPSKLIDQLGRETLLNYDNMWNLAHVIEPNGAETRFIYNELNQLETVQKSDGSTVFYQYDKSGKRTGITDELGNQTQMKYDALGRLVEILGPEGLLFEYTYNTDGQLTSGTDALGNTVSLTYDKGGQLIQETNALGDSRKYTYTPLGKVASVMDESGRTTHYSYELGGRLKEICFPDNTIEVYSYDDAGNVKAIIGRGNQSITYDYDCLNRVIQITNSAGTTKSYTYDSVGNVTSMTDGNGNITQYSYTATGKLRKVVDPLGHVALYFYDERDQLITICQDDGKSLGLDEELQDIIARNGENSQLRITRYERNIMGQVEAITDALGHRESYSYDLRGQLIEKLDKDGYLTIYGYTSHGDLNHIQYGDGREVKYSYNPLRQLTQVEDWLGLTKIEMDALGRATKVTNPQGKEVSYSWGATGQRTGVIYPDGTEVKYDYDDCLRLTEVADDTNKTLYRYDEHSRLTEKLFSNGTKTTYQYNKLGYLQEMQHSTPDVILDRFQYFYDHMGNKTKVVKERHDLPEESSIFTYSYDPLHRLQEVLKDGQTLRSYEYDGYGNRCAMTEGDNQTSYTYNSMNQLISTADSTESEQSYIYDKRGNLVERYRNSTLVNQYHFDALNRLEQVTNHETGLSSTYRYNGLGYRVGQSTGVENSDLNPTKQIDDVLDLTRKFNNLLERQEGDVATNYTWDTSLLSLSSDGGSQSYLLDELGSPVRLMNEEGIMESYGFDEFGNTLLEVPNPTQPFGFTGYQHDSISETWFAQSREYDSQAGRFTGKDLNRYMQGGVVQSLNLYQYCNNNPVRYIDPMGFDLENVLNDLFPDSDLNQNAGSNDAVQIGINGNVVTLDVFVDIQGDIDTTIDGYCVVDLTIQGIEAWGGVHVGPFGEVIAVEVNVHQGSNSRLPWRNQSHIPVNIVDGPGVSNLRGGWSPRNPGTITLHTYFANTYDEDGNLITLGDARTWWQFVNVSGHEFGHGFGVNDANREWRNDSYRLQGLPDRFPDRPAADMLRDIDFEIMGLGIHERNMYISRHSIQMMIYAIMSGGWQRFMEYERGPQSITLDASLPKNQVTESERRA